MLATNSLRFLANWLSLWSRKVGVVVLHLSFDGHYHELIDALVQII